MQKIKIQSVKEVEDGYLRICPSELAEMMCLHRANEYVSEYVYELVELSLMDGFSIVLDGLSKKERKKIEDSVVSYKNLYNVDVEIE